MKTNNETKITHNIEEVNEMLNKGLQSVLWLDKKSEELYLVYRKDKENKFLSQGKYKKPKETK